MPVVVRELIKWEFSSNRVSQDHKIRLHPPSPHLLSGSRSEHSVVNDDIAITIPQGVYDDIEKIKEWRRSRFGKPLTDTVGELPHSARATFAVPAILQRIVRIQHDENLTISELEAAGYLNISLWKVTY